jgi:hypothetical protein
VIIDSVVTLIGPQSKDTGKGVGDLGKGVEIKEIKLGPKGKILTVDKNTTRDTDKYVTSAVCNNKDIHLRNTEERRLGTVGSISTAGEFKPVNGASNLTLAPPCSYKRHNVNTYVK